MGESTLGIELKIRREALGMAVDDFARAAHISVRYVGALEEGDYRIFPAKIYAHGAVRHIARLCASGDGDMFVAMLDREWPEECTDHRRRMARGHTPFWLEKILPVRRKAGAFAVGASFAFILGFWALRLFFFTAPPILAIMLPDPNRRITASAATVSGRTEKESRLTVNGREIRIDERGAFHEDIELPLGKNELRFVSESRFGKTSTEVRYVLVE